MDAVRCNRWSSRVTTKSELANSPTSTSCTADISPARCIDYYTKRGLTLVLRMLAFLFLLMSACSIELMKQASPTSSLAGRSVLDVGCGNGFQARAIRQAGASRVVGVDLSAKMIEIAEHMEAQHPMGGLEFRVGDATDLGDIGQFDHVVMLYVLSLMDSRAKLQDTFKSAFRNTRPGGQFVLADENVFMDPTQFPRLKKYSLHKTCSEATLRPGCTLTSVFDLLADQGQCTITTNYLGPKEV